MQRATIFSGRKTNLIPALPGQKAPLLWMDMQCVLAMAVLLLLLNNPGVHGDRRVCKLFPLSRNHSLALTNGTVRCKSNDYCFGVWIRQSDGALYPDRQGLLTWIICLLVILLMLSTLGLLLLIPQVRTLLCSCSLPRCFIPSAASKSPQNIELLEVIGQGKYGIVWKGLQRKRQVAVKVFPASHQQHFQNEYGVYSLQMMQHQNIVKFIRAAECKLSSSREYLLITEYYPEGSLSSYLTQHHSSWRCSLKMAQSVTAGVSFLHTEIWSRGFYKPVVVHRDLSSDNILVNEDGSCVISDFSLATVMSRDNLVNSKQAHVYMVGTYRYMAPELLDGSINLGDCVTTLKQADMYSLGLVLWEIFTRCTDLFTGSSIPEYQPVYQAEIGSNPTLEEMVMIVARGQRRPRFPARWKESLVETISDSWDHDPEARLSAQCLEQRLGNLSACMYGDNFKSSIPKKNTAESTNSAIWRGDGRNSPATIRTPCCCMFTTLLARRSILLK
ncbi:bone morphogenetic protein receptor type-2-like isoform X2 [Narcine bancroftii]|uniref:bone morphogenetic protein receptor type-2-like isoform X2 n=1 Tax=Narcine bancroftii TaxID=1343680 RepID=UPI00383162F5